MADTVKRYIKKAQSILNENWTGSYTIPSLSLYPHQWNWDSGFIAIGYSHFNTDRALREVKNLFDAQWKNGMLPQIVFNRQKLGMYFPEPDFW
ncbi:MAG: glycoside hydrolase, partial [Thermodesulfovibrionia bacterium]|nr:glycoside hydrolase [Thermodesulfovibrionia bacterium]